MRTYLLVGEFRHLGSVLASLAGARLIHCHSLDAFRNEWNKNEITGVVFSVRELSPSVFSLLKEGQHSRPQVKWILFVQEVSLNLNSYNGNRQIFFQGQVASDWAPRLTRWLRDEQLTHRRGGRQTVQGGVRLKGTEFSKTCDGQKSFGRLEDLGPQGAGLVFEGVIPFPAGEFVEAAFRDTDGRPRVYHGQVRWVREVNGETWVGLQFLAAA